MTIKTLLIAFALVLGFAGAMSLIWNVSAWMIGNSVVSVEPAPRQAPFELVEPIPPAQSDSAKKESVPDPKENHNQPTRSGAYDDNWTGTAEPKPEVGLPEPSQVQPEPVAPVTESSKDDRYPSDDRETDSESSQPTTPLPSAQNADPYKGDDHEGK